MIQVPLTYKINSLFTIVVSRTTFKNIKKTVKDIIGISFLKKLYLIYKNALFLTSLVPSLNFPPESPDRKTMNVDLCIHGNISTLSRLQIQHHGYSTLCASFGIIYKVNK